MTFTRLGEVARLLSGGTPSKSNAAFWSGDVPWLTPKDMGRWTGETEAHVTRLAIGNGTRLASANAVFLAVRGMSLHTEIRVVRAHCPITFNQDIKAIEALPGLDPEYLYYSLAALKPLLLAAVVPSGHGTGTLPTHAIENLPISRFEPRVERSIAELLSALDDKIELNRRTNETLEASARSLFRDWFIDFGPTRAKTEGRPTYLASDLWSLFPDRFDDNGVPEGWTIGILDDIIDVSPTERLKRGAAAPYLEMAALPTSGSSAQPAVEREFSSGSRFRNGDALLARITPCLENGKTAFVQGLPENTVGWGSTEFIVLRSIWPVPEPVSYLIAREDDFRSHAIRNMTGTSGRQRVSAEAIANYPMVLPNDDRLWRALSPALDATFERIARNQQVSQALVNLRDGLLPKLMSGELRVRDAKALAA